MISIDVKKRIEKTLFYLRFSDSSNFNSTDIFT